MKTVLIISPNFPPINTPDMHRVRQSLPYFAETGWKPIVVTVTPEKLEGYRDPMLTHTVPPGVDVRTVNAFDVRWTRKVGLGSVALRSLLSYVRAGNQILTKEQVDLIYFSTTMMPLPVLGSYWKRKFGVPYVIDLQDPWHTEYYVDRPKEERPHKFWFSYRLHRFAEPIAMRRVNGIVSVSQGYCDALTKRYSNISPDKCVVIPFGAAERDLQSVNLDQVENTVFERDDQHINIVCIGAVGRFMNTAIETIFRAFQAGLVATPQLFGRIRIHFVGTNYSPSDKTEKVRPTARRFGLDDRIFEHTRRVPYFTALRLLADADMLLIPGSDDPDYTASRLFPCILSHKPILAVCQRRSSIVEIIQKTQAGEVVAFSSGAEDRCPSVRLLETWTTMLEKLPFTPSTDWAAFAPYTAREMTRKQNSFFDRVVAAA